MNKSHTTALDLIRTCEGCQLQAYADTADVLTIGYGHTRDVHHGKRITLEQAEAYLQEDTAAAAAAVDACVKVPLTQNQRAALIDFVFNLGPNALRQSSLLRCLNAGNYTAVPTELRRWNKARVAGKLTVLPGLTRRRQAEATLWVTPDGDESA